MSQKSREMERRAGLDAMLLERDRCALHVQAMIGILKRGAGQPEPWSRLEQALARIQQGTPVNGILRDFALSASTSSRTGHPQVVVTADRKLPEQQTERDDVEDWSTAEVEP